MSDMPCRGSADRVSRGPGRAEIVLAALLAAVAGSVDVLAVTSLGHAFASIVTGNIVVIGVSIAQTDLSVFLHVATAVLLYGMGVALGSAAVRQQTGRVDRWPLRATVVCAAELLALFVLAVLWIAGHEHLAHAAQFTALGAAALAMGLQSAAFRTVNVPGVTTTYFTGTLTGLLAGLATSGRLNADALLALIFLLAGAIASGLLVTHAASAAAILPLALLALVLVIAVVGRSRPSSTTKGKDEHP